MYSQTMSEVEIWRLVPGFDGYEASTMGRVRSYRHRSGFSNEPHVLRFRVVNGYHCVTLYGSNGPEPKRVARLVLETFVGPCPDGMEARHVDDNDRANNRLSNLAWGTRRQNAMDRVRHGTAQMGDRHWTRQSPELVPRGAEYWTSRRVAAIPYGDRSGFKKFPHLYRGDRHWSRSRPERIARGARSGVAKISEGSVRIVKMLLALPPEERPSCKDIAAVMAVSESCIKAIKSGQNWSHI